MATMKKTVKRMTIEDLARVVATKKDLVDFATKKDLDVFATKRETSELAGKIEELTKDVEGLAQMIERNVAMKEDLKGLATKKDLDIMEMRLEERLDGVDLDIIAHDQRLKKLETKTQHI